MRSKCQRSRSQCYEKGYGGRLLPLQACVCTSLGLLAWLFGVVEVEFGGDRGSGEWIEFDVLGVDGGQR